MSKQKRKSDGPDDHEHEWQQLDNIPAMAEESSIGLPPAGLMTEAAPEMAAPAEEAPLDVASDAAPVEGSGVELIEVHNPPGTVWKRQQTPVEGSGVELVEVHTPPGTVWKRQQAPVEGLGVELVEAAPADAGFANQEVAPGLEAGASAVDAGGTPIDPTAPTTNLGLPGAPAGEGLPPISSVLPRTDPRVSAVQSAAAEATPTRLPTETAFRLPPDARANLVIVRGLKANLEYPVYEGPNYIGRHGLEPVDIDLTDQESEDNCLSSRRHACITWENENLFIEDMKSSNGTFVMRVKLTEGEKRHLKNGEYVQVGSVLFRVQG